MSNGYYRVTVTVEVDMSSRYGPGESLIIATDAVQQVLPANAQVVAGKTIFIKDGTE